MKEPYTPTRTCPHRWCKPLHVAPIPFAVAGLAFDMWHNWRFLVMVFLVLLLAPVVTKAVHFKRRPRQGPVTVQHVLEDLRDSPGPIDLEMQDARYEGTGWRVLEVRKGWARVAVGCDMLLLLLIGVSITAVFASLDESSAAASAMEFDLGFFISVAVAMVFFGFSMYAHKKATQPRKPKKAWVPAFLRTNA